MAEMKLEQYVGNVGHCEVNANGIVKDEWNMTVSAPDIVAVVRCKDCKWYHENDFSCEYWEDAYGQTELYPKITPIDYCFRGVRKESEE